MNVESVINQTEQFVREKLGQEGTGHDWWHVERVRRVAMTIAHEEGTDLTIVELAALLHDIADWKFNEGDLEAGPRVSREWLQGQNTEQSIIDQVCDIIRRLSYKGAGVADEMSSLEGQCVQDADRLDAIGAIGIARCFAYGGKKGRPIHDPNIKPAVHTSADAYRQNQGTSLNHFYEKLLLLKDRMITKTGKQLAQKRHEFLEKYLEEFLAEWDGAR